MHTIIASLDRPDQPATSPPNISTRTFIQWLPDPPSEPTSTEVLTSRQKFFVDIRILKDSDGIDWAFAGRSESHKDEASGNTSTRWHHMVDSRFLGAESVVDQAEMMPEDPESGIALEKGSMVNPATGVEAAYVEGWRETGVKYVPEPLSPVPGIVDEPTRHVHADLERQLESRGVKIYACDPNLRRLMRIAHPLLQEEPQVIEHANDGIQFEEGFTRLRHLVACCVLQHENDARQSRGTVIRVGQFCQGVLRVGDEFAAERWEWTEQGGWRKVFASGSSKLNMPCDVACHLAVRKLRVGNEVVYGPGEIWQCVEEEQWKPV
jgi:hypothetical protein